MKQSFATFRALVLPVSIIIGRIGVFLLIKLRPGQDWDGDFALYLMNAENIIHGVSYAKTPYLFNPTNAINPAAYPPGLPLLFAPVTRLFGVNVQALKLACVVALYQLLLGVFWALARRQVGRGPALIAIAAVGLNPYLVSFSNSVESEFPFMLFCYAGLLAFERLQSDRSDSGATVIAYVTLAAVTTALAYLTRSVGMLAVSRRVRIGHLEKPPPDVAHQRRPHRRGTSVHRDSRDVSRRRRYLRALLRPLQHQGNVDERPPLPLCGGNHARQRPRGGGILRRHAGDRGGGSSCP